MGVFNLYGLVDHDVNSGKRADVKTAELCMQ